MQPHGSWPPRLPCPWDLKWVAISFSRGSSQPRNGTCISCIGRQILYCWATWESHCPFPQTQLSDSNAISSWSPVESKVIFSWPHLSVFFHDPITLNFMLKLHNSTSFLLWSRKSLKSKPISSHTQQLFITQALTSSLLQGQCLTFTGLLIICEWIQVSECSHLLTKHADIHGDKNMNQSLINQSLNHKFTMFPWWESCVNNCLPTCTHAYKDRKMNSLNI